MTETNNQYQELVTEALVIAGNAIGGDDVDRLDVSLITLLSGILTGQAAILDTLERISHKLDNLK